MRLQAAAVLISVSVVFSLTVSCGDKNPPDVDASVTCSPECGTNATCNDGTCTCVPFSSGDPLEMCVADCSATGCANGDCEPGETAAVCLCDAGWTGPACDQAVDACATPNVTRCQNGGTCVSTGPNSFSCDCLAGFTGAACETAAVGCPARPCDGGSCTVGSAGAYTCVCERGFSGTDCDAAADACTPDPCVNAPGGACMDADVGVGGDDYTCSMCTAGSVGTNCEVAEVAGSCGAYVDVVYRIAGSFRVANTPLNLGNVTKTIGTNTAAPQFAHAGVTSPFAPTDFANGFVRLRFHNVSDEALGTAGGTRVEVIEWYVPIEFDVDGANIPTVRTNVDHSAGIIGLTNRYAGYQQTIARACQPVASGTLTGGGMTLDWDGCGVTPTGGVTFKTDLAQANVTMDDGCLRRLTSSGNTRCVSGSCGIVPSISVGDQRSTWDQPLRDFTFSGTDYATATFTMPEIQLANDTGTTTWLTITSATPSFTECADAPTCDEVCDADSCQTLP